MASPRSLLLLLAALSLEHFATAQLKHIKYIEVLKPISKPTTAKKCSIIVMKNTRITTAPFSASIWPPSGCGTSWSVVSLSWSAYVNFTGYHLSIGNVFIDGVNVLKTVAQTNLENYLDYFYDETPVREGSWNFEIDLTKYGSFLKQKRRLSVDFGPNLHSVETFKVNLSINYFTGATPSNSADTVVPLSPKKSPNSPFDLSYSSRKGQVSLSGLPRNVYRAEVEIVQIQSGSDTLYWTNYPDKFRLRPGGGTFRETLVYVDGLLAGATWQFPLVWTSEYIEWDPILPIGAFVVPSYRIDITPFVGRLVDGKSHTVTFAIVNPSNGSLWSISGVLHMWLDKKSKQTNGKLISRQIVDVVSPTVNYKFTSLDFFNVTTTATRNSTITGYVSTSFGNFTATTTTKLYLSNRIQKSSPIPDVVVTHAYHTVGGSAVVDFKFKNGSRLFRHSESFYYPLTYFSDIYHEYSDITETLNHGYNSNKSTQFGMATAIVERLANVQSASIMSGVGIHLRGSYDQTYSYQSNSQQCYYRNISASEGTINLDRVKRNC